MDLESKKISKNASEAAAYWVLRLESRECKPADRLAFEIWRKADPLNSAAYLRAQKGLASVDGQLGSPELSELSEQILIETRGYQKEVFGIAVALSLLLVVGIFLFSFLPNLQKHNAVFANTYSTGIGERSTITLSDRSVISLNTESRVLVDFNEDAPIRRVELLKGQAHFEVKSDLRPFEVFAGDRRILALGTSFDIKLDTNTGLMITLVEGHLAIAKANMRFGISDKLGNKKNEPTKLKAGEKLIIKPNSEPIILASNLDPGSIWQGIK